MNGFSITVLLVLSGLVLSLNPFSISVFSSLLAGALGKGHSKGKVRTIAFVYLLVYWLALAVFGAVVAVIVSALSVKTAEVIGLVVAAVAIIWGMVMVKNYFWDKPFIRAPFKLHGLLHTHTVKKSQPHSAMVLGLTASLVTLCHSGIQLVALGVIIGLVAPSAPQWMIIPAICLILPLKLIYWQVASGFKVSAILKWSSETRATMHLALGLANIALGWIILLIINGVLGVA